MDTISVQSRQTDVVKRMLSLDSELHSDWKFLICDSIGEDIFMPLFSVKDLKFHRVTLRLPINSTRDPVPDVSAVYFVLPTDDNIKRICQDLRDHLYDSYYLNFISSLPKPKLEMIAKAALDSDSAISVKKVFSQYSDFIALEDDFFILRENDKNSISYYSLHRNDASDSEITAVINQIVESLFSLLVTLKVIPIIRSPKGGPAEVIATNLANKIREKLDAKDSPNLFNVADKSPQPLLCLVDRTVDMSTPLHHTWTYQALVHDLLNTDLNKVKLVEYDANQIPKTQLFDLNKSDEFWLEQRGKPFPQVAEAVQKELDSYKKNEDKLTSNFDDSGGGLSDLLSDSSNAARTVTELREKKRIIAMHTSLATNILDEIKSRRLDNFFELEEKIMNRSQIDRPTLDDILSNPKYGKPSDKLRLFLIAYICDNPKFTDEEAEIYIKVLENLGCDRAAFDYVKNWKKFSKTNVTNLQSSLQASGGVLKTASMFTKLMSQGSQFVMSGVKNLVLKEHLLPLTKIVDGLMDSRTKVSREAREYTYLDPKASNESDIKRKRIFQSAIVFVVGGGNYIEYQNLVEYCKSRSKSLSDPYCSRHVIYGSTDLMNATQFLQQLQLVGES